MALSNLFSAFEKGIAIAMPPPGISSVTASAGATGAVSAIGIALGTFSCVLQVLTTGALGTATAQLSLDNGNNFGPPFTLPAGGQYDIPLGTGTDFAGNSGLSIALSGTFTEGDGYIFQASATPTFRVGAGWSGEQNLFPRVVWIPTVGRLAGTEDFSGSQNQSNSPAAIRTWVQSIEAECWGADFDRTELLLQQVVNGIYEAAYGSVLQNASTDWTRSAQVNQAGERVVLTFDVKTPITTQQSQLASVPPPLTGVDSPEVVDDSN